MVRSIWRMVKIIFTLCVIVLIALGVLNVYFHFVNPLAPKIKAIAQARMTSHHVQALQYSQIPTMYKEAVIATEDRRFATDPGIDPVGILRSFLVDIEQDGYVEGGSTITQQLVDNTILSKQKTLHRKILQIIYAIGLYDTLPKDEVLTLYANVIYFGHGAYGLANAAQTYFGRSPNDCNAGELTLLAGLPNAPSVYDPFHSLQLAKERQNIVLENMVDDGVISAIEKQKIAHEPLRLKAAK